VEFDAFLANVGFCIGAGMFVVTVVVGAVSIAAKGVPATVTRRPFLRDIIFYQLVLLFVFFLCWDHKIRVWQAALFIVFYFSYVGAVLFGRLVYQRRKKKKIGASSSVTQFRKVARNTYSPFS
jgi:sodium/potassium/calcium exchanger 6